MVLFCTCKCGTHFCFSMIGNALEAFVTCKYLPTFSRYFPLLNAATQLIQKVIHWRTVLYPATSKQTCKCLLCGRNSQ